MRLFEFDEEGTDQPSDQPAQDPSQDGPPAVEDPLTETVTSLILRLQSSQIKKIRVINFIQEMNNIMAVPVDTQNPDQVNHVKEVISATGKVDVNGEYIFLDYSAPADAKPSSDAEKIAMKNIRKAAS